MNSLRGFRPPANAMSSVLSCQPHSPRASKVSDTCCASPGVMGCASYPSVVHPQLRSYRVMATGFDARFSIQSLSTATSPECMRPKRTVSVPPVSRIVSVTAIIRPFRPVSPVRACRVPHAAVVTASASNNNPRSIGTQIRPRPAFLMRPSAVSDSTILSSTPLMKVLLPGVE